METRKLRARIIERFGKHANLADAAGIDPTMLSKVVQGRRGASKRARKVVAKALGIRVEDLPPVPEPRFYA